jgi:hypothetical protein
MKKEILCASEGCECTAPSDKVFDGTLGGLWGPYWFCTECDLALIEQLRLTTQEDDQCHTQLGETK